MSSHHQHEPHGRPVGPDGFSLVELLVVVVVLGIVATVVVFSVRGVTDRADESTCAGELNTLSHATEAYFAAFDDVGTSIATQAYAADTGFAGNAAHAAVAAPAGVAAGASPGQTLVNAGFLRSEPTLYWILPSGGLVVADSQCGTVGQLAG